MSMMDDIGNALSAAKARLKRRATLAHAWRHVSETPEGKIVLNDLFAHTRLLTDRDAPCDTDTRAYDAGRRAVAVHILDRLRWSEAELLQLARQQTYETLGGDDVALGPI